MNFESVLIVGGSSGLGQACAIEFLQGGARELILVLRESDYFDAVVSDFRIRFPEIAIRAYSFTDNFISVIEEVISINCFQVCLIALGTMIETKSIDQNPSSILDMNHVNMDMAAMCLEIVGKVLASRGGGYLSIFGSVAGDRGRAVNYHYGATKAYLETIVEGFSQRYRNQDLITSVIKPGPTLTRMTENTSSQKGKLAKPEYVARVIVKGIKDKKQVIYAPRLWKIIMVVIRLIPKRLFNSMNF